MNNQRRKEIAEIQNELADLLARVETLRDEEQDAYDNMPEGLQQSDRGTASEQAASNLDQAAYSLQEVDSLLTDAAE